jgi:hypothetical protein
MLAGCVSLNSGFSFYFHVKQFLLFSGNCVLLFTQHKDSFSLIQVAFYSSYTVCMFHFKTQFIFQILISYIFCNKKICHDLNIFIHNGERVNIYIQRWPSLTRSC